MQSEVFLDAAFAIALVARSDQLHARAQDLSKQLEVGGNRLVTTRAVLLEIGNALAKRRYRTAAASLLSALDADANVLIYEIGPELYLRAFGLYQSRADKDWGLIDGISFLVMQDRGITEALTADEHFEQAGFHALLRSS